ncbi:MAG: hypothetical protein ACR2M1_00910, partial [Gemmatimonadaceae bacterium]
MRRPWLRIAQWLFAVIVISFVSLALVRRWDLVSGGMATLRIDWIKLAVASLFVLSGYAVLIETWRRVLAAWDTSLDWTTAAEIWFASSLGKYVPGSVWALAAAGVMARQRGASAVAAAGSSVLVTILNLLAGFALVLLFAARLVQHAAVFAAVAGALVLGAISAPVLLPRGMAIMARLFKRDIPMPRIPASTIWWALAGTALAWCAYGVAFRLFAAAVLGDSAVHGDYVIYIAAYMAAYLLGFVALFGDAGSGVA